MCWLQPVRTRFGYHIIKLTDVKIPKQRSFDELRAGIETELKTQQAQRKFAEAAEQFTNLVYEQSEGRPHRRDGAHAHSGETQRHHGLHC